MRSKLEHSHRLIAEAELPSPRSVGIIGHGNFGKLLEILAERFTPGLEVRIFEPGQPADDERFFSPDEVASSDIVILSVPISETENALRSILPFLKPETIIVDVATVKEYTADIIKRVAPGQPFFSLHAMFGPESYKKHGGDISGFPIVVTDSNLPEETQRLIVEFLRSTGVTVIEMSSENHDRLLAETLFVTHLVGQVLKHGEFTRTQIDTPSFTALMDAVDAVKGDTRLFQDVYRYNRFCKEVLQRFGKAEEEVHKLLVKDDEKNSSEGAGQ